jgi:DNA-directed RNA polymerase specialized sigma24 family protein
VTLALEGFSPEDIADVLGLNISAASVRLHRGKALLKDMMKGLVT